MWHGLGIIFPIGKEPFQSLSIIAFQHDQKQKLPNQSPHWESPGGSTSASTAAGTSVEDSVGEFFCYGVQEGQAHNISEGWGGSVG